MMMRLTEQQKELCKEYLRGNVKKVKFNILFQTFRNEYIALHGYENLQKECEHVTYVYFCNYALMVNK